MYAQVVADGCLPAFRLTMLPVQPGVLPLQVLPGCKGQLSGITALQSPSFLQHCMHGMLPPFLWCNIDGYLQRKSFEKVLLAAATMP